MYMNYRIQDLPVITISTWLLHRLSMKMETGHVKLSTFVKTSQWYVTLLSWDLERRCILRRHIMRQDILISTDNLHTVPFLSSHKYLGTLTLNWKCHTSFRPTYSDTCVRISFIFIIWWYIAMLHMHNSNKNKLMPICTIISDLLVAVPVSFE